VELRERLCFVFVFDSVINIAIFAAAGIRR